MLNQHMRGAARTRAQLHSMHTDVLTQFAHNTDHLGARGCVGVGRTMLTG